MYYIQSIIVYSDWLSSPAHLLLFVTISWRFNYLHKRKMFYFLGIFGETEDKFHFMFLVMQAKIIMMIKKRFYLSSGEQETRFFVCNVMLLVILLCLTNHHHKSMSSGHFYVHDRVNIINKQKPIITHT